ncbi:hypothetical protein SERLA73DRAFT_110239 [Serpula lacrymans var. lacrymans S7.3]|uniref:UBX domain-containing protein n=1 Tax=Serpula lacrymans var. lacrymans (strain S7.3) TaxID=936435 RepID=F8Q1R9_SERL3|nr:hypothetical protein SERLA73DRAFT_110239 [Serpula lacrymans var. lacrymans S7.3]
MDHLNPTQREALSQLQAITAGSDAEVTLSVLESVDWDVQKAAELIFDGPPPQSSNAPVSPEGTEHTRTIMEELAIDDSQQGIDPNTSIWNSLLSFFSLPFHVLSNTIRFLFGILRISIPSLHFTGLHNYRSVRTGPSDHRSVTDRWVRSLEEETGALSVSSRTPSGISASGAEAGPSSIISRTGYASDELFEEGRKVLPDFFLGSYEDVLNVCQREGRVACIVLVSEEHDDVPEFKRSTLTDPALVKALHDGNFVIWGGDVRDRDAWSAAQKLQATTYPFVAFIALQPRRNHSHTPTPSQSVASPTLTVLSRHQGRSVPDTAPTSAATLLNHLSQQLLPRVTPFLERFKASIRERERDRMLREEQDRAFQDSARRDRERIEARIAAEKAEKERLEREREQAKKEEERAALEREKQAKKDEDRMEWRRWMRRDVVRAEPQSQDQGRGKKGGLRLAIRLPQNERAIRYFTREDTLTQLYAYVDTMLIPPTCSPSGDPKQPPGVATGSVQVLEEHVSRQLEGVDAWWGFKLALAYPRQEIRWEAGKKLCDVDGLGDGGQLVVELVHNSRKVSVPSSTVGNNGNGDDGYDTESDEE